MLKNVLSLLLSKFYSKQESELIARQAMPLENKEILVTSNKAIGDWGKIIDYTAPTDGFINVFANKDDNAAGCDLSIISGFFVNVIGSQQGGQRSVYLPMRKGASCSVWGANLKNLGVRFIYSVGGGYKNIIWRAVLCLSSYSNCFWKPSLNPRNLGSVIRPCRLLLLLHTLMLKGKNGCTLPLLMTDTFTLWQDKQPALIFQQRFYLYCLHRMEENFLNRLSRLRKVVFSGISFMEEPRRTKQRLLSFQSTARCNLNVGGALC